MAKVQIVWSDKHNRNAYYNDKCDRLPEICIFDLANVPHSLSGYSAESIIKIWQWLLTNIKKEAKIFHEDIILVSRKDVENEIRAVSPAYPLLESFKDYLLNKAITQLNLSSSSQNNSLLQTKSVSKHTSSAVLNHIRAAYAAFGPVEGYETFFKLYTCDYAIIGLVWKDIQKLGKSFVFVAHSGIPYMMGFCLSTNNDNTFLTEFHLNGDPYNKYRKSVLNRDFISGLNDTSVLEEPLIIDRSYSGQTLTSLKRKIPGAKSLALFPKTRKAIETCDYFIFNNRVFSKEDVNFSNPDWYTTLAAQSLEKK